MEKKQNIIIVLLVVLLVSTIISNNNSASNLRQEIQRMDQELNRLNDNLHNLCYDINNSISQSLIQANNKVNDFNCQYNYENMNASSKTIPITVSFTLSEKQANSTIIFQYGIDLDNGEKQKIDEFDLPAQTSLTYSVNTDFSYDNNYWVNVFERTQDGAMQQLNMHDLFVDTRRKVESSRAYIDSYQYSESSKKQKLEAINFSIETHDLGQNDFALDTVELFIFDFHQNKLIDGPIDITNQLSDVPVPEIHLDNANAVSEEGAKEEYKKTNESSINLGKSTTYYGNYVHYLDVNANAYLEFFIVVTFKDGYVISTPPTDKLKVMIAAGEVSQDLLDYLP